MAKKTPRDEAAHWQNQIATLEEKITAQDDAVTEAQEGASQAALTGDDTDTAVRQVAHARDVLDALHTALGEARRHLRAAEKAVAAEARDVAHDRAKSIARRRIETADQLDEYMTAVDRLVTEWTSLGTDLARETEAAGMRPCGTNGHDYRIRAATWATAPAFMGAIEARRVSADHRVPFRQITAAQAAPVLTTKGK